jgi:hypothetical protein
MHVYRAKLYQVGCNSVKYTKGWGERPRTVVSGISRPARSRPGAAEPQRELRPPPPRASGGLVPFGVSGRHGGRFRPDPRRVDGPHPLEEKGYEHCAQSQDRSPIRKATTVPRAEAALDATPRWAAAEACRRATVARTASPMAPPTCCTALWTPGRRGPSTVGGQRSQDRRAPDRRSQGRGVAPFPASRLLRRSNRSRVMARWSATWPA